MSTDIFKIKDAPREQLEMWLKELRDRRKKGYEITPKRTSRKKSVDPFADLDPEIAERILKDMMKEDGG